MTSDLAPQQRGKVCSVRMKALPPSMREVSPAELFQHGTPLTEFPTPLVTLDGAALKSNIATMATWCRRAGIGLAPHGKTTMSQAIWKKQLDAGAWGITVATPWQLGVAIEWGIPRILLANEFVQPAYMSTVADTVGEGLSEIVVWADSVAGVAQLEEEFSRWEPARPLRVQVEVGAPGGRCGTRSRETSLRVAEAITAAPHLRLAGVAGYEGVIAHDAHDASLATVRAYLEELRDTHHAFSENGLYPPAPEGILVAAGGSAYFDLFAEVLAPLHEPHPTVGDPVHVLLNAGSYVTHDDGFYRGISPLGSARGTDELRSALNGWSTIISRPEPGLVILDGGKRDFPFDEGLPVVQGILRRGQACVEQLAEFPVAELNDQHTLVCVGDNSDFVIGDVLKLGLSHPCTTFDKWRALPVLDDSRTAMPQVVDMITTDFG